MNNSMVIIYGRGGHQAQMERLIQKGLIIKDDGIDLITMTDSEYPIESIESNLFQFREFRNKHSYLMSLLIAPFNSLFLLICSLYILMRYKVKGVVSTGPGLSIIPVIVFWIFRVKIVVFEDWSKFYEPSITAKILYRFSGLFIIQNKTLKSFYPKAQYWGRL